MRDPDDFDEFYRVTVTRLTRFAYSYTGDVVAAQDLAQESYARAWQHWERLREYDNPEAWLRTVAGRLASSRWRRLRRYALVLTRLEPPPPSPPPTDDVLLLVSMLRRLSEPVRTVMILHHLLDRPVSEVARELGIPIGTVKARLVRGRAQLAQLLSGSASELLGGPATGREVPNAH